MTCCYRVLLNLPPYRVMIAAYTLPFKKEILENFRKWSQFLYDLKNSFFQERC